MKQRKRVLIWGNGKSAQTVRTYIENSFNDEMVIKGYIVADNNTHRMLSHDKDLFEYRYLKKCIEQFDCIIIPNQGKKIVETLEILDEFQDKEFLYVSAAQLRTPKKEKFFCKIVGYKPWLSGFEYHVADHCNLNCKGCGHCANLYSESFPSINTYIEDLDRLSELFESVGLIRLLGGEPLLNNQLGQFIKSTREHFENAEIHVVTNGILIRKLSLDLIKIIRDCGVILDISVYPPIVSQLDKIKTFLFDNSIEYNCIYVQDFYKRFNLKSVYDKNTAFVKCETSTCHALYNGKIAPCIVPFSAQKLNEAFGCGIKIDGWIDIYKNDISADEINNLLTQPFELCKHCNPEKTFFKWESSSEKYQLEDWVCD